MNRDHPDYSFVDIGQNTGNSSGDQKRLAVTHTPVKDHQLRLMVKNSCIQGAEAK